MKVCYPRERERRTYGREREKIHCTVFDWHTKLFSEVQ